MGFREGWKPCDLLVDLGIIFHGAGAERIDAAVDTEIALGQRKIVPHHLKLRHFRQAAILTQLGGWKLRHRHVGLWHVNAMPAGNAQLIERRSYASAHRLTSLKALTSRSMFARELTSVTASSMCSRRCA